MSNLLLLQMVLLMAIAQSAFCAEPRRSWLSCVQELNWPVVNDMNQGTFRGLGKQSLSIDLVLDEKANADLARDWKPPTNVTFPMLYMMQFVNNQTFRKECAGKRFRLMVSIELVERDAGRQDSRIRDDDTIELVYHDNGTR